MILLSTIYACFIICLVFVHSGFSQLSLVVTIFNVILAIVFSSIVRHRLGGVFFFFLSYLLTPHSGMNVSVKWIFHDDFSIFLISSGVRVLVLCFYLLRGRYRFTGLSLMDRIIVGSLMTGLVVGTSHGIYLVYDYGISTRLYPHEMGDLISHDLMGWLSGILIYVSCRMFCKTREDIQSLINCCVISGVLLIIELLFHKIFPGSFLSPWAFHESGRFSSIIYLSYDKVGLVLLAALAAILYQYGTTRRSIWLTAAFGCIAVALLTYQKVNILAVVIAVSVFLTTYFYRSLLIPILGVLVGGILLFALELDLEEDLFVFLGGRVRGIEEYSADTLLARVGLWARGIDVAIYTFPFGAGEGFGYSLACSPEVPHYFDRLIDYLPVSSVEQYYRIINAPRATDFHNLYIKILGLKGLAGAVFLISIFAHYFRTKRAIFAIGRLSDADRLLLAFTRSTLISAACLITMESSINAFHIFAIPLGILVNLKQILLTERELMAVQQMEPYGAGLGP